MDEYVRLALPLNETSAFFSTFELHFGFHVKAFNRATISIDPLPTHFQKFHILKNSSPLLQ